MKKVIAVVAFMLLTLSTMARATLPYGLNISVEGGAVFNSNADTEQAYAQFALDKHYANGLYVGVGMIHMNNLGDAVYSLDEKIFYEAEVLDNGLRLPGLGNLNNVNNAMIHAGYEYSFTRDVTGLLDVMYVDDIKSTQGSLGIAYRLSSDIEAVMKYVATNTDNDNYDVEGIALALRATF